MVNDFTNGDHSFKNWLKIMWQNNYIQIFSVAFTILIVEIFNMDGCMALCYGNNGFFPSLFAVILLLLPITVASIVAYKGFYQFWSDLKSGNTR